MKYTIDVNEDYYLEVEKKYDTSSFDQELYVAIIVTINHRKLNYFQFKPIIMVECVYEKWLISKLYGLSWGSRIRRNEIKLIKKAKKHIHTLPNLLENVLKKIT
jgi:hypothetical protein